MDYQTFLHKCIATGQVKKNPNDWMLEHANRRDLLMDEWIAGGERRGWLHEVEVQEADPEPQGFHALELVLEMIWPDITFLQFRRLCRKLVKYDSYTDSDYYSRTHYHMKYVNVMDLYQHLQAEGVL